MAYETVYVDGTDWVRDVDGVVVERRPVTQEEQDTLPRTPIDRSDMNATVLREQARSALNGNRTFLNLTTPTNAQNAAQIKALTRQLNGLIRLTLGQLDNTD